MYHLLWSVVLWALSFPVIATEDFQKMLKDDLKVEQTVIDTLVSNGIASRDRLCKANKDDLRSIGIKLGDAIAITDFCTPEKPAESVDASKLSDLDLLNRLAANPQDANVLEALQSRRLVKKAEERTTRWAVVEIDDNGQRKLDAAATLDYLEYLNLPTQPALLNKNREGKLIESVEILGKTDGQILIHPLFDGQCISRGIDDNKLDWSKVPADTMKALLWARETGHESFLRLNLDGNRVYAEVAKEVVMN